MILGTTRIGPQTPAYLIAEIGVNHEGSMDAAKRLIESAARAGASCAKFQAYKADRLAVADSPAYWDRAKEPTETQRALFAKYDGFGPAEYAELAAHCRANNIDFACTPFDAEAVQFLDPLVSWWKVASADITNVPLLRLVGARGKPVVVSTGAATNGEVDRAHQTLRAAGAQHVALLHCVLAYPTAYEDANLWRIRDLKTHAPVVGYSDHTSADEGLPLLAAYLLGARIIEKHFTLTKRARGNDHFHSADENDLRTYRRNERLALALLGDPDAADFREQPPFRCELPAREFARRSIVAAMPIAKGERLTVNNLTWKRPGTGIGPERWDDVVGRLALRDLSADQILMPEDVAL